MTRRLGLALLLPLALAEVRPQSPAPAARQWTQTTFLDFGGGRLEDGGANTYVAADGSVRLINRWDLNHDGYLDLVFPSSHDNNHGVDSYVYWGKTSGFDPARRTRLPGNGAAVPPSPISIATASATSSSRTSSTAQKPSSIPSSTGDRARAWTRRTAPSHHRGGYRRRGRRPGSRWVSRAGVHIQRALLPVLESRGRLPVPETGLGYLLGVGRRLRVRARDPARNVSRSRRRRGRPRRRREAGGYLTSQGQDSGTRGAFIYWGAAGGKHSSERRTRLPGTGTAAVAARIATATPASTSSWPTKRGSAPRTNAPPTPTIRLPPQSTGTLLQGSTPPGGPIFRPPGRATWPSRT